MAGVTVCESVLTRIAPQRSPMKFTSAVLQLMAYSEVHPQKGLRQLRTI